MPPRSWNCFYFLASSPNQVFTREQLLDHIWGYEYIGIQELWMSTLKDSGKKSKVIPVGALQRVWGIGYKFEVKTDEKKAVQEIHGGLSLVGFLGFLLVTLLGSHMIESQLEKKISAQIFIRVPTDPRNEDIRYNISASSLDSIRRKAHYGCRSSQYHHLIINERGEVVLSTRKDISPRAHSSCRFRSFHLGKHLLSGRLFLRVL